ncbi:MAG: four helix bundle protein [Bacteroidetes bacterium]|nr:four helix bundle protein [Bacteroidota bacterium]MBK8872963.1 four helix bundle protein [Bacteroidota bacterium]
MKKLPKKSNRNYDLADRLLAFNTIIGSMCDLLKDSKESSNIKSQLMRSVSSAALNYGEVLVAESRADFIHKISICLKELMESKMAISIIEGRNLCQDDILVKNCLHESSQLVAIFISSVNTARKNAKLDL